MGSPLPLYLEAAADSRRQEEDTDVDSDIEVEESMSQDWADQVEEEFKEEGSKRDKTDRKPETGEEVIEELRRRLDHKATGPPPVCRVRALGAFEARAEDELSFQPGSIITVHRISEAGPGWLVGALDGKKGYVPANTGAWWAGAGGLEGDLLEVIRTEV